MNELICKSYTWRLGFLLGFLFSVYAITGMILWAAELANKCLGWRITVGNLSHVSLLMLLYHHELVQGYLGGTVACVGHTVLTLTSVRYEALCHPKLLYTTEQGMKGWWEKQERVEVETLYSTQHPWDIFGKRKCITSLAVIQHDAFIVGSQPLSLSL